ncbi:hypothetical protein BGZ98_010092, partial [Dissophora globulifera]
MLSAVPRQVIRATSTRQIQSVTNTRYYSSGKDSGEKDSNTTNSESDDSSKPEGAEALMSILSSSPTAASSDRTASASSKGNSAALILETLTKVTDRQQQATSRTANFLNSRMFLGGPGSGRAFLGEPQPCSHNLHIHASMNNTILTLTDSNGDPITTQSAGSAGFKKAARSGPEAGYQAMA